MIRVWWQMLYHTPTQTWEVTTVDLKDSQYQGAMKFIYTAIEALHQVSSGLRRRDEPPTLRRRLEEAEGLLKKAKRELRIG